MRARVWTRLLWTLTGLALVLVLVKSFVADVYRVDSGSMRPTLFGGRSRADGPEEAEHVLVRYTRDLEPERFDLVVIRAPDGKQPLVKRVCGLPGETNLSIDDGDLLIGRERLPPDVPRPPLVPIYDDFLFEPTEFFEYRRDGSVQRENGVWVVDGEPEPPGNLLAYHLELRDDYLDRHGERVPGLVQVNDARVSLEVRLEVLRPGQVVRVHLVEQGDVFEVELRVEDDGRGMLSLLRLRPRLQEVPASLEPPETLASREVALPIEDWFDLALSNVDNHLHVESRALGVDLRRGYEANRAWPEPLPISVKSRGPRVRLGTQGGRARFRDVRIERDLYYTDDGTFGTRRPLSLGPGEYFLLGDNSAASTDSRHFGPIEAGRLLGTPVAIVWPSPRGIRPAEVP